MQSRRHIEEREIAFEALESANQLIARALARLHSDQSTDTACGDEITTSLPAVAYTDSALLTVARQLVRERKNRLKFFQASAFGEPVWDILLDLYIASCTGALISVSSACIAAHVPPTTALRYITMLTREGMLERTAAKHDCRVMYVALSEQARNMMGEYLSLTLAQSSK